MIDFEKKLVVLILTDSGLSAMATASILGRLLGYDMKQRVELAAFVRETMNFYIQVGGMLLWAAKTPDLIKVDWNLSTADRTVVLTDEYLSRMAQDWRAQVMEAMQKKMQKMEPL